MKWRGVAAHTGCGGNAKTELDGIPASDKARNEVINACAKDFYETFIKDTELDQGYCDAQDRTGELRVGVEPSYMYERMKFASLRWDKTHSAQHTGFAFGPWGSDVRSSRRLYKDYQLRSKFVRFIDRWHRRLFENPETKRDNGSKPTFRFHVSP